MDEEKSARRVVGWMQGLLNFLTEYWVAISVFLVLASISLVWPEMPIGLFVLIGVSVAAMVAIIGAIVMYRRSYGPRSKR